MKGRNKVAFYALMAVLLVAVCGGAAFAQGSVTSVWSPVSKVINDPTLTGSYQTRDMAVDETSGDVFLSVDATGAKRQIIRLALDGTIYRYGPIIKDTAGVDKINFGAYSSYNYNWGVAFDPLSKYLYVSHTTGAGDGRVEIIDIGLSGNTLPAGQNCAWVGEIKITDSGSGFIFARGMGISDDGMKLAIAGSKSQTPGRGDNGAVLYTRTDTNGNNPSTVSYSNPELYTDDTWTYTAALTKPGRWVGAGSYIGSLDQINDVAIGPDGSAYCVGSYPFVLKYSTTAPYDCTGEIFENDRKDSGNERNDITIGPAPDYRIFLGGGRDNATTPTSGPRNIWVLSQMGTKELCFLASAGTTGSSITVTYAMAYDKTRNRLYVAGRDAGTNALLDCYTPSYGSDVLYNVHVNVKSSQGNTPIQDATVGVVDMTYDNSSWITVFAGGGMWSNITNASGNAPVINLPGASTKFVVQASAPGYVGKRLWAQDISTYDPYGTGEINVNVTLDPVSSVDSVTWTAPPAVYDTATPPATTGRARQASEEKGLFLYVNRNGGRNELANDPVTSTTPVVVMGNRTVSVTSYPGADAAYDNYLNFDIDDNWVSGPTPLWITIEYLDYSASSQFFDCLGIEGDFTTVNPASWRVNFGDLRKSNTVLADSVFKKVTYKATLSCTGNIRDFFTNPAAPAGSNWLIGADFRLNAHKEYDNSGALLTPGTNADWIKSVTVSKVAPAPVAGECSTISAAKNVAAGETVILRDKQITAGYGCYDQANAARAGNVFYISEPSRTGSIKVTNSDNIKLLDTRVGRNCSIYGTLQVDPDTGEPFIQSYSFSDDAFSLPTAIAPTGATSKVLGTLPATGQSPLTATKITAWGNVTAADSASNTFTLNDGSGSLVVKLDSALTPFVTNFPNVGDYVSVVGIASLDGVLPTVTRVVKPWLATSINYVVDVPPVTP